jgi:hypothetical protein
MRVPVRASTAAVPLLDSVSKKSSTARVRVAGSARSPSVTPASGGKTKVWYSPV